MEYIDINKYYNQLINDDCLNILKQLPDKSIDLILTDPPYGIGVGKKTVKFTGKVEGRGFCCPRNKLEAKDWDDSIPSKEIFDEIFRVSKNQIIWGGNYFTEYLSGSSCWIVWDKDNGTTDFADCELAYTSFNSAVRKFKYRWNGCLIQDPRMKEEKIHPTQKPIPLFQFCIEKYSKPDDIILDPFSGSGTTAIAAFNSNRTFICIEKDKEYYNKAIERFNNHKRSHAGLLS